MFYAMNSVELIRASSTSASYKMEMASIDCLSNYLTHSLHEAQSSLWSWQFPSWQNITIMSQNLKAWYSVYSSSPLVPVVNQRNLVKFEVVTVVAMKNAVVWVVMPCGSCMNRCFRGMHAAKKYYSHIAFLPSICWLLVTANVVPSSLILSLWWWRCYIPPKHRFL
jgi:hypothetical protein